MTTITQQIACVARELALRRNVYPCRVTAGRMSQADADTEIASMVAVLATLERMRPAFNKPCPAHDDEAIMDKPTCATVED
jgi:hypothetical protein